MQGPFTRFLVWAGGAAFVFSLFLAHTAFLKLGLAALTLLVLGISQCRKGNASGWTYGLLLLIPGLIAAIAFAGHRSSHFGKTQDPRYRSLHPDGATPFLPRAALAWIPEADIASSIYRIGRGLNLVPGEPFRADAMAEYDRLASGNALTDLRSQTGLAVGGSGVRHLYLFVPEGHADRAIPLIVFLHPAGANWQYNFGRWAAAVADLPAAVAAPSFGAGNWAEDERGIERVRETLDYLLAEMQTPPNRIILAGAGNGGSALWRRGGDLVDRVDGYIVVAGRPRHHEEAHRLKQRPVLVIHGGADEDVRIGNVSPIASICTAYEPLSRFVVVEGAGAHVFGTHHRIVFDEIRSWLETLPAAGPARTGAAAGASGH